MLHFICDSCLKTMQFQQQPLGVPNTSERVHNAVVCDCGVVQVEKCMDLLCDHKHAGQSG